MPIASTPWHQGERAALADMFQGNGSAYALAKSRIATLGQVATVACPIVGSWLASHSLRLPWAVAAIAHVVQTIVAGITLKIRHGLDLLFRLVPL
jgi:hypothetical protein